MNFHLTEDQKELQMMYRDFTDKEIRPRAQHMDETGELDEELWAKMAELGSFGIITPEEYGGVGLGFMEQMIVMEEVVRGSGTVYHWIGTANGPSSSSILAFGTEEQKREYVPSIATGKCKGAFALTEPGAGSDANGIITKAVKVGDNYVINGTKTFCSMASKAVRIITIARAIEDNEEKGFTAFIVPTDTPGLTITEEHKMGMLGTPLCEVSYQDVVVPAKNILGKVGQGMEVSMSGINESRTACAAFTIGLAQEAIDLAVAYSKERMQFGKRISQFQNTQFVLAECQTNVEAARLMMYKAAASLDEGIDARIQCAMAKDFAAKVCDITVFKCLQVFGGYGYCKGFPIERIYRDARVADLFDGSSEIQKGIIAKARGDR